MFFYFYKITNSINEKFYYGVHSTKDMNDGYMGSGKALDKAYKKYGMSNFKKEILKFFSNSDEMFEYEQFIVSDKFLKENSHRTYNMMRGGRGGFKNLSPESREKGRLKLLEYYKNISDEKRKEISDKQREFLKSSKGQKVLAKATKAREEKRKDIDWVKRNSSHISKSLKKYWEIDTEKKKSDVSQKNKFFFDHHPEIKKQMTSHCLGYTNPDFKARWEKIYLGFLPIVRDFICNSDMLDNDIKRKFNMKVKLYRLLEYYQFLGKIKIVEKKQIKDFSENFNIFKSKTVCKWVKSNNTNLTFKKIKILNLTKISKFNKTIALALNMGYSDSYIIQGLPNYREFKNNLAYFEDLGLISIVGLERINIRITCPNSQRIYSNKTIIKLNFPFKMEYILYEENTYNERTIELNNHGELILY